MTIAKRAASRIYRDDSKTFSAAAKVLTRGVSVVIPFRGAERLDNLNSCLQFLPLQSATPLEVVVVEHSPRRVVTDYFAKSHKAVKYIYVCGEGKFNKSIAVNVGVLAATYDAVSIHDVDLVLPSHYMKEVADALYGEYEACFFLKELFYLRQRPKPGKIIINANSKRSDYFNGGSVNIRKDSFIKIGGMDESFCGYGHEDCEFWTRVQSLTRLLEDRKYQALHMYHKRPHKWSENTALYESIVASSMDERLARLRASLAERQNHEETIHTDLHTEQA